MQTLLFTIPPWKAAAVSSLLHPLQHLQHLQRLHMQQTSFTLHRKGYATSFTSLMFSLLVFHQAIEPQEHDSSLANPTLQGKAFVPLPPTMNTPFLAMLPSVPLCPEFSLKMNTSLPPVPSVFCLLRSFPCQPSILLIPVLKWAHLSGLMVSFCQLYL